LPEYGAAISFRTSPVTTVHSKVRTIFFFSFGLVSVATSKKIMTMIMAMAGAQKRTSGFIYLLFSFGIGLRKRIS
jgi:hypothetical protein